MDKFFKQGCRARIAEAVLVEIEGEWASRFHAWALRQGLSARVLGTSDDPPWRWLVYPIRHHRQVREWFAAELGARQDGEGDEPAA